MRGQAFSLQDRCAEAIADFNAVLNHDPQNTRAYQVRGFTFLLFEQTVDATADFSSAILLDLDRP